MTNTIMDKYLEDRVKCLENERRGFINCLRVTLSLLPTSVENKEARGYLEKIIIREGKKDAI